MSYFVQIREIVRTHGPIKARQVAAILNKDYGISISKSDVNSCLYKMKSQGEAKINNKYEWILGGLSYEKEKHKETKHQNDQCVAKPEIHFTDEQKRIIELDVNGNLLIRGQAGSGKTTVLAARAGHILSSISKGSLLFITYNAALCSYVRQAVRDANLYKKIRISTYHEWAKAFAKEAGHTPGKWADGKWKSNQLKEIIKEAQKESGSHRLYDIQNNSRLLSWWEEEISWIFGQGIRSQEEYLLIERVGRGSSIRLNNSDRHIVWDIFKKYNVALNDYDLEDYDNAGGIALNVIKACGGRPPERLRYDHVFIDEVQDFHQSWLMSLAPIARVSLSMAGDLAQKIYKRTFTWKSVGIEVRGSRSKRLGGSHRTTHQIMEVALSIVDNTDILNAEGYVAPTLPKKHGPLVKRILRDTPQEAYSEGYSFVKKKFGRLRSKTVALALPTNKQAYGARRHLQEFGISGNVAKGDELGKFSNGIVLTTYHQLKGLEFDHIVIMGLNDSNFPGVFIENIEEEDLEDELCTLRRLIYVAMTRSKESLTLVGSKPFCRFYDNIPKSMIEDI